VLLLLLDHLAGTPTTPPTLTPHVPPSTTSPAKLASPSHLSRWTVRKVRVPVCAPLDTPAIPPRDSHTSAVSAHDGAPSSPTIP
jgi:hypothetical protein